MTKSANYGWADGVPNYTGYLGPAVRGNVRGQKAVQILNAGCGNGSITAYIAQHGFCVLGVDGHTPGIALEQRHFPAVNFFPLQISLCSQ